MSELVYELSCDSCGTDYEVNYVDDITDNDGPMYCPFCSAEIDLTDVEEEFDGNGKADFNQYEFDFED